LGTGKEARVSPQKHRNLKVAATRSKKVTGLFSMRKYIGRGIEVKRFLKKARNL